MRAEDLLDPAVQRSNVLARGDPRLLLGGRMQARTRQETFEDLTPRVQLARIPPL